jgi:hypothetical protein
MMDISAAISWKFNDQEGMSTKAGVITKFPETEGITLGEDGLPTAEDQAKWLKEYEDHLASTEYQRKRKDEYPSFEDQFDDLYHNGIDGWKAKIKVVKDKYAKP